MSDNQRKGDIIREIMPKDLKQNDYTYGDYVTWNDEARYTKPAFSRWKKTIRQTFVIDRLNYFSQPPVLFRLQEGWLLWLKASI